jgi:50S ribosomal protein L16 3-hydroxylase
MLQRISEHAGEDFQDVVYKDPGQGAVSSSAEIPIGLHEFVTRAVQVALADPLALAQSLGEYLTEPKANVWFEANPWVDRGAIHLDRRTRMMYDDEHVFINGESFRAAGTDAKLMRILANTRQLESKDTLRLSAGARELLMQWCEDGWVYAVD